METASLKGLLEASRGLQPQELVGRNPREPIKLRHGVKEVGTVTAGHAGLGFPLELAQDEHRGGWPGPAVGMTEPLQPSPCGPGPLPGCRTEHPVHSALLYPRAFCSRAG